MNQHFFRSWGGLKFDSAFVMTSPQALHMRSSTQERQSPEEHRGSHTKIMVGQCPVRGPVENVSIMGLYYFQKRCIILCFVVKVFLHLDFFNFK